MNNGLYWSSSTAAVDPEFAFVGNLTAGNSATIVFKSSTNGHVWPVRGGR